MVHLRRFEPGDAPTVANLIAETMRVSNAGDYPRERLEPLIAYFSPEKLCQLATERYVLVALADQRLVATGALDDDQLATFFVHPHYQRRGVGTRLLRALEHAAREAGTRRLRVEASLTGAPFYERHGYRRVGEPFEGTAGPQIPLMKALGPDRDLNSRGDR